MTSDPRYHVQLQNKVQPAKMRVGKANEALEIAKQKLCVMEAKIKVLQERLDGLQESYEQATIDKGQCTIIIILQSISNI